MNPFTSELYYRRNSARSRLHIIQYKLPKVHNGAHCDGGPGWIHEVWLQSFIWRVLVSKIWRTSLVQWWEALPVTTEPKVVRHSLSTKIQGYGLPRLFLSGPTHVEVCLFFSPRKYPGRSGASTELEDLFYLVLGFSLIRFSLMYRLLVLEFRYNGR